MLAIWDDGVWQDAATLAAVIFGVYLLVVWLAALAWVYRDIQSRTRDQAAQALSVALVFVFNVPGLVLYLILRPKESLMDAYERQLEAEALLHEINDQPSCPSCRRRIGDDFIACPYCRAPLRTGCESCGKPLVQSWVLCPYCGVHRAAAQRAESRATTLPPAPAPPASTPAAAADAKSQVLSANRARRPSTATYTPPAPQRPDDVGTRQ